MGPFAFRGAAAAVRVIHGRLSACTRRRPWILRIAQLRPGRYDHDQQNVEQ